MKTLKTKNLHVYRQKRRLTQKELAYMLGVSRQTVINLENNKFLPSLELAFKISNLFDCKIEDIWNYEEIYQGFKIM